jgi:hypothetical protein
MVKSPVGKVLGLWFLSLLTLQSSAWAQRQGHAVHRPGHFGARYLGFHGRVPSFYGSHRGYGRPGVVYRFPSYRPYQFSQNYGAFRHYSPYPPQYTRYFSSRPHFYPVVPFGFGVTPYSYGSVLIDPYWPGIGYNSRYLLEERPRVTKIPQTESRSATEPMWLLALNDGSIRAARNYWLEDDTLRYSTRDGKSASVPLSELDLSFTLQLNRERSLDFRLPKPSTD